MKHKDVNFLDLIDVPLCFTCNTLRSVVGTKYMVHTFHTSNVYMLAREM